jgi:5'-3' exonuclease
VRIHLLDGTYELFRQFFGQRPRLGPGGADIGATWGVVRSVVAMLEDGATHVGVATDHVIESFRNDLWPGYKTGLGVPAPLADQFPLVEAALEALGVVVWPMIELEADDAMASAAAVASDDPRVEQVLICTPDKDLAQCVVDGRIVQLDRRTGTVYDDAGIRDRYGVAPPSIPDWLALVGDSADGFPGLTGWGKKTAASVLAHYGHLEAIPATAAAWEPGVVRVVRGAAVLARRLDDQRDRALLFKRLATLVVDRSLLAEVDDLRWAGPSDDFPAVCELLGDGRLADHVAQLARP